MEFEVLGPIRVWHDGEAVAPSGDADEARESWQHALAIYRGLDVPEAHSTQAKLDQLD